MNLFRKLIIVFAVAMTTAGIVSPSVNGSRPEGRESALTRELPELRDITLGGELGARYQAATCNLLTRPERYSLQAFRCNAWAVFDPVWRFWPWPGDLIGRYLSNLHVAEALGWTPARALRADILKSVLPLQQKRGNFGAAEPDVKNVEVISGNAFALRGLMDAYEDSGDPKALAAARRLAEFFEASYDYYKDRGPDGAVHEFYGHCADGLVRLHVLGGDAKALDLAQRIGARVGLTRHTHHSLSMCRGIIDLYQVTRNPQFLKRVEAYLSWVRSNRIVTGGVPEEMPKSYEDEGCAEADYVLVNLMMFAATGEDAYLDEAENSLVNHFFMNQFHTGGFGHRLYDWEIIGGNGWQGWDGKYGSENPGCCSLWGQWGLGNVGRFIATTSAGAVEINLYPAARVSLPALGIRLAMESDFPRMRRAILTVDTSRPAAIEIRLRVPRWAETMAVDVNGADVDARRENGRLCIRRVWHAGDVVGIQFKSGLRLVRWPKADSSLAAVFDGPLCLGLSSADGDVDGGFKLLLGADGRLEPGPDGRPQLVGSQGLALAMLRPIAEEWQSPELSNPHRVRVLFGLLER
jgi:hypothetical protein